MARARGRTVGGTLGAQNGVGIYPDGGGGPLVKDQRMRVTCSLLCLTEVR